MREETSLAVIYRQVDGIVMGSALSIVVANLFMYKAVEEQVLRTWVDKLLSYKRYMDDVSAFLLAIEVERDEGMHMTDISYRIYRKPGNSMAYLQVRSFHLFHTSLGMIKGEFLRYLTKSSKYEFYLEDIRMLINAFSNQRVSARSGGEYCKKDPLGITGVLSAKNVG